jgi:small redox-active disulfide protein 2
LSNPRRDLAIPAERCGLLKINGRGASQGHCDAEHRNEHKLLEDFMEIKVLGTGCANCKRTKALSAEVIKELQIDATVVEVTDIPTIMGYGVMSTPGIVINEKVVGSGGVPTKQQMVQLIQQAL